MEIKFSRTTDFLGRNGSFQCTGLSIHRINPSLSKFLGSNHITIFPITSKNKIGRCFIVIPQENVSEVCAALQGDLLGLVLDHIDQKELPPLLGLNSTLDEIISKYLKKGK